MKLFFTLFLVYQFSFPCTAQNNVLPIQAWVKNLSVKKDIKQAFFWEIVDSISQTPNDNFYKILDKLENRAGSSNKRFQIRLKLLRAVLIYRKGGKRIQKHTEKVSRVVNLLREAILDAYKIDDQMLVAQGSAYYGMVMYNDEFVAPGVMYCQNAIDIQNRIGAGNFSNAGYLRYTLGLLIYRIREYKNCISYMRSALNLNLKEKGHFYPMNAWNTIGLAFSKLGKPDSAFLAYNRAMDIAKQFKDTLWMGVVSGNMAHILFEEKKYDSARVLLEYEYTASVKGNLLDNAANSLRWLAKIKLAHGKKEIALQQLHQAYGLLSKHPQLFLSSYRANIYQSYAEVYHSLNQNDSSFHYLTLYMNIQDSLNKSIMGAKAEIAGMIAENRNTVDTIVRIQNQKKAEKKTRNYIIASLLLVLIVGLLLINQQRIKLKHRQQIVEQRHALAGLKIKASQQQLELFKKNIKEKTALLLELQTKMNQQQSNEELQKLTQILLKHGILTNEDWINFKRLFEEIHPTFFITLKQKFPDISSAELRLASLTKLQLSSQEIASILGISPGSVYKSKQRLRNRFKLASNEEVEKFIAEI